MNSEEQMVRPFSNGSEFGGWRARNCHHCGKYNPDKYDGVCEIDGALGLAYIGLGEITKEIAERIGTMTADGFLRVLAVCPEQIDFDPRTTEVTA